MVEARRLLVDTDDKVDRIAARVGFAEASHFRRLFRRSHAMSPTEWRVTARAGGPLAGSLRT